MNPGLVWIKILKKGFTKKSLKSAEKNISYLHFFRFGV